MRDEVVAESAPARSFSDSVIDLSSMETVPAEHLPSGGDRADDDPAKRHRGAARRRSPARVPAGPLEPRSAALAQRPQPVLPVRRRVAGATRTRSRGVPSSGSARPGCCSRIETKPLVQRAVDRMLRESRRAPDAARRSARRARARSRRRRMPAARGRSSASRRARARRADRGTYASSPSSSATGRAMSSSAQITSVGTLHGHRRRREARSSCTGSSGAIGGRSGDAR